MKRVQLLALCLLMAFATQAMSAQTGKDCEAKGKQVAAEKRDAFLKSCLVQTSAPANVQEITLKNKRQTCEQNARNLKLNPGSKPGYIETCVRRNDAEIAAKNLNASHSIRQASNKAKPLAQTSTTAKHKAASQKTAKHANQNNSCSQQVKGKGLKGNERKQFMQDCRKS